MFALEPLPMEKSYITWRGRKSRIWFSYGGMGVLMYGPQMSRVTNLIIRGRYVGCKYFEITGPDGIPSDATGPADLVWVFAESQHRQERFF